MTDDLLIAIGRGSSLMLDSLGISLSFMKEFEIIQYGPSHKWWLSARLLLGLTEDQARQAHDTMKNNDIDYRCNWQWWRMMVDYK